MRRGPYVLHVASLVAGVSLGLGCAAATAVSPTVDSVGESILFIGNSLTATNDLRARTGASVLALYRDGSLVPSPTPDFKLAPGDRLGLIGDPVHVEAAERLVASSTGGVSMERGVRD